MSKKIKNKLKNAEDPESVIKEEFQAKYEELQGRQLYVRFPHKIPEDDEQFKQNLHALTPLITQVHKPRQRYARFCMIDFKDQADRDLALKDIKKKIKKNEALKGYVVSLPRTENPEFRQKLLERKLKSFKNKKAKKELRLANKQALKDKNLTSAIVVKNVPRNTSKAELRKLFPNAVDIQIKSPKSKANPTNTGPSVATITMPSIKEAHEAVKQKLSLAGTQLVIKFNIPQNSKDDSMKGINARVKQFKSQAQKDPVIERKKRKVMGL